VSLSGTVRDRGGVQAMVLVLGWRSPRTGVRFALVFVPRRRSFSEGIRGGGCAGCASLLCIIPGVRKSEGWRRWMIRNHPLDLRGWWHPHIPTTEEETCGGFSSSRRNAHDN